MKELALGLLCALLVGAAVVSPAHAAGEDAPDDTASYAAHLAGQSARAGTAVPGDAAAIADAEARTAIDQAAAAEAFVASSYQTAAATGFTPGNLIADANFTNGNAMSESAIQAFLVKMGGALANFTMPTENIDWSYGTCEPYVGAANESAARIIFRVQEACSLSARVILVTLQKEQSLLTDETPSAAALSAAMGYECSDSAPCDPEYAGFFRQVAFAARQLTWYGNSAGSFTWLKVGQPNAIAYNTTAACGSSNVTIANAATAALYYYTPYQPNAAAIDNLYGTGDACSAYGNRNFWRMYTDWFGDPRAGAALTSTRLQGADRYATAAAISLEALPRTRRAGRVRRLGIRVRRRPRRGPGCRPPRRTDAADRAVVGPGGDTHGTQPPGAATHRRGRGPRGDQRIGGDAARGDRAGRSHRGSRPLRDLAEHRRRRVPRRVGRRSVPRHRQGFPRRAQRRCGGGRTRRSRCARRRQGGLRSTGRRPRCSTASAPARCASPAESAWCRVACSRASVRPASRCTASPASTAIRRAWRSTRCSARPSTPTLRLGAAFPDALTGAAAAGSAGDPLFLSPSNCVPPATRVAVLAKGTTALTLLGGTGALSARVASLQPC